MKVLILGATGLVGQSTLVQAVTHPAITQVIAPTRKALPPSSKLTNPVAERLELLLPEVRPCLGDWCRRQFLILLSEDQGRGREGHEASWLQISDDPPAQHHWREA